MAESEEFQLDPELVKAAEKRAAALAADRGEVAEPAKAEPKSRKQTTR